MSKLIRDSATFIADLEAHISQLSLDDDAWSHYLGARHICRARRKPRSSDDEDMDSDDADEDALRSSSNSNSVDDDSESEDEEEDDEEVGELTTSILFSHAEHILTVTIVQLSLHMFKICMVWQLGIIFCHDCNL